MSDEKLGCLGNLFAALLGKSADTTETIQESVTLPYKGKDYFFSAAERSFYENLRRATPPTYVIFSKARLIDLVYVPKDTSQRRKWLNYVTSKHVDFVICEPKYLKPILIVELDDSSHERDERKTRDAFVDKVAASAGIRILHFSVRMSYHRGAYKDGSFDLG